MGWFGDVPDDIRVGRDDFQVAEEAIARWEMQLRGPNVFQQRGDRPDPDWPATRVLLLARLQLEQAIEILLSGFDIDAKLFSGGEVSRRLYDLISSVPGGHQAVEDFTFEIQAVGEGVDLWRALREAPDLRIHHAFRIRRKHHTDPRP